MATQGKKRGITALEVVVILAVIAILVSILFPMFTRSSGCSRSTQCVSRVRQLALAVQMYVQDNNSRYPSANWAPDIENYVGSRMLFACPSDAAEDLTEPVSYGYSGLLLRPDGTGVEESRVLFPTEVGAICDAGPTREWPGNGIVYGGGLLGDENAVTPISRHNAVVIGYCDGHARMTPREKEVTVRDIGNGVSRAFVQAVGLGMVENFAGGMHGFAMPKKPEKATIFIGGDSCVAPIILASLDVWTAKSSAVCTNMGFTGQDHTKGRTANYLWGIGDGIKPKSNAIPIARDAMVLIVAKNCKIADINKRESTVDAPAIRRYFAQGYAPGIFRVYTYNEESGSRRFFTNTFADNGKPLQIGKQATTVTTDIDMVDAVAGDPYGIGYCSAAFADPDRVSLLKFKDAGGKTHHYPNDNPKYATVLPEQPSWPLTRTLYVAYGGKAWRDDGTGISNVMLAPGGAGTQALHDGPLFKASYYLPE